MKKAKSSKLVIIGSGLAGYTLVREIRRHDKDFPITVITADSGEYYSKPQLSNALTHQKQANQLALFTPEKFSQQFNIDIKPYTVLTSLDDLECSHLIFATGAKPVLLPELKQAYSVNNLDDYRRFREAIKNPEKNKKITIVGAGLVGCEFANDLLNGGYEVTVIAPEMAPLANLIPIEASLELKKALENKGVKWQLGRYFQPGEKEDNQGIILSAVGLRPNTELAKSVNLNINRGIIVNEYCETSQANIYALGDCAEVFGQVLPYIQPLTLCARALAKTILGELTKVEYPCMPVHIKTPAYPVVVTPIPPNLAKNSGWELENHPDGLIGLCYTSQRELVGFCVTGSQASRANEFLGKIQGF